MIHFENFSEISKRNISNHIHCIKLQSVSPLIGNKCKCLVMPGWGAMNNTSVWLLFQSSRGLQHLNHLWPVEEERQGEGGGRGEKVFCELDWE